MKTVRKVEPRTHSTILITCKLGGATQMMYIEFSNRSVDNLSRVSISFLVTPSIWPIRHHLQNYPIFSLEPTPLGLLTPPPPAPHSARLTEPALRMHAAPQAPGGNQATKTVPPLESGQKICQTKTNQSITPFWITCGTSQSTTEDRICQIQSQPSSHIETGIN
jgi:hypothetical protein